MEVSIISAFIAGILTFLAPCTLPLVPAYLGFIGGVSFSKADEGATRTYIRRKLILNGTLFISGFTLIFVLFGVLAGYLGQFITANGVVLTQVGGIFVVIFGLFMLGVLHIPALELERRIKTPSFVKPGNPLSSFILGSVFALGWSPCLGPILGSILLLATTSGTTFQGAALLLVYSIGLSIPFFLTALLFGTAVEHIKGFSAHLKPISMVGGVLIVILGTLMLTNNYSLLSQYAYVIFDFINYEKLYEFF